MTLSYPATTKPRRGWWSVAEITPGNVRPPYGIEGEYIYFDGPLDWLHVEGDYLVFTTGAPIEIQGDELVVMV